MLHTDITSYVISVQFLYVRLYGYTLAYTVYLSGSHGSRLRVQMLLSSSCLNVQTKITYGQLPLLRARRFE